jgi:hypothetical protein
MAISCPPILGYMSRKKQAIIPWSKLIQDPFSWIEPECIPDGFKWADPSKLRVDDVELILNHWHQRQERNLKPLIWASSCPLLEGADQLPDWRSY